MKYIKTKQAVLSLFWLGIAVPSQAANIMIDNFSFVDPSIGIDPNNDTYTTQNPPSWTTSTSIGYNGYGVQNPANVAYAGTGGGGVDGLLPGTAEGYTYGYMNLSNSGTFSYMTYSGNSLGSFSDFTVGSQFTLTVAIGDRLNETAASSIRIELLENGIPVSVNEGVPTEGTFTDLTSVFIPTTQTGAIGIRITGINNTGNFQQANFDNVRLAVIPEPSSFCMAALTSFAFLARRRR